MTSTMALHFFVAIGFPLASTYTKLLSISNKPTIVIHSCRASLNSTQSHQKHQLGSRGCCLWKQPVCIFYKRLLKEVGLEDSRYKVECITAKLKKCALRVDEEQFSVNFTAKDPFFEDWQMSSFSMATLPFFPSLLCYLSPSFSICLSFAPPHKNR